MVLPLLSKSVYGAVGEETSQSVEFFSFCFVICFVLFFSSPSRAFRSSEIKALTPFGRGRVESYKIEEGKVSVLLYDPVEVLVLQLVLIVSILRRCSDSYVSGRNAVARVASLWSELIITVLCHSFLLWSWRL